MTNVDLIDLPENDSNLHFEVVDEGGCVYTILYYGTKDIAYPRMAFVDDECGTDYIKAEAARLKKRYPGIRVNAPSIDGVPYTGDLNWSNVEMIWDFPVIFYNEENYSEIYEKNAAIFKNAKKFIDNKTGKTYILTIGRKNEKIAYTLYSEEIISDYNFEEVINRIPLANNITLKQIRKDYQLIAL